MGGILIIYKLELCFVQYKMSIKIENPANIFEVLRIPSIEYKESLVDEKEICLNGKMYDIKSVRILSDSVELLVTNDTDEEKILEYIKGYIKTLSNSSHKIPIHFTMLLSLNYIIPNGSILINSPLLNFCLFCDTDTNLLSDKPDTVSPPPRYF